MRLDQEDHEVRLVVFVGAGHIELVVVLPEELQTVVVPPTFGRRVQVPSVLMAKPAVELTFFKSSMVSLLPVCQRLAMLGHGLVDMKRNISRRATLSCGVQSAGMKKRSVRETTSAVTLS